MDLSGKVAIVTGGAQGIGHAIVEALLRRGCKVCIADVLAKEGTTAEADLNERYGAGRVMFSQCDVTREEEFRGTFGQTISKMGPVCILANNAGMANEANWEGMVDVNFIAVIRGIHLGFEYMGKDRGGKGGIIINTSSEIVLKPIAEMAIYSGTKHAIVGLSRCYGMPFHFDRTGVAVKAICPTAVNTEMMWKCLEILPNSDMILDRFPPVEPHYVADGFLKLVDEENNGTVLHVAADGYHYV